MWDWCEIEQNLIVLLRNCWKVLLIKLKDWEEKRLKRKEKEKEKSTSSFHFISITLKVASLNDNEISQQSRNKEWRVDVIKFSLLEEIDIAIKQTNKQSVKSWQISILMQTITRTSKSNYVMKKIKWWENSCELSIEMTKLNLKCHFTQNWRRHVVSQRTQKFTQRLLYSQYRFIVEIKWARSLMKQNEQVLVECWNLFTKKKKSKKKKVKE